MVGLYRLQWHRWNERFEGIVCEGIGDVNDEQLPRQAATQTRSEIFTELPAKDR